MSIFLGNSAPSKIFVGDSEVSSVRVGDQQVRPTYWDYTPTSNTLVYYPFKEDINDYSGNNKNLSIDSGTVSYADNKITISSGLRGSAILNGVSGAFTISFWTTGAGTGNFYDADGGGPQWYCSANGSSGNWWGNCIINGSWKRAGNQSPAGSASDFVLITVVYDGSKLLAYLNGTQTGTTTNTTGNIKGTANYFLVEGGTRGQTIIEKGAWSEADIQTYYNNSKGNYGL